MRAQIRIQVYLCQDRLLTAFVKPIPLNTLTASDEIACTLAGVDRGVNLV